MKQRWLRYTLSAVALFAAMNFLSCGNQRKLVSIDVQPPSFTFFTPDPNGQAVFTALGTYMHPPDRRDITGKVMWKTDNPQVIQVNGGVVSPVAGSCGIGDISASLSDGGNLIIAYATVTVNDPTRKICPGGNTTLAVVSVTLAGPTGAGMAMSSPGGISCPSGMCIAQFNVGDTIGLTATPSPGHTFTSWTGCTQTAGTTCSILVPTGSTNVTATFN